MCELRKSGYWREDEAATLDRMVASGVLIQDAADRLGRPRGGAYARRHNTRTKGRPVPVARVGARVY